MNWSVGEITTAIGAAIGVVVWLVRLEGAQKTQGARHDALEKDVDEVKDDIKYIRERIDREDRARH